MAAPVAVYARVLDGAHLWLAVRGAASLRLGEVDVPTEADGDLLVAVLPLGGAFPDGVDELRLLAGTTPVRLADVVPDSPTRPAPGYTVVDDGGLLVRRTTPEVEPGETPVVADRFVATDDGASVRLSTSADRVDLVRKGTVIGDLPVVGGVLEIGEVPALGAGETATLRCGGTFVTRARNVLVRPNFAVLLPPLPGDLELRWLPDGRLGVKRA